MNPEHKNIEDLKNAWTIRWKKAMVLEPIEIANIIIAIWLKVDIAIIFFISFSQIADNLEEIEVIDEIIKRINIVFG